MDLVFAAAVCVVTLFLAYVTWYRVAVPAMAAWAVNYMNKRPPDFVIRYKRDNKILYLQRWHVVPRNNRANVYLHYATANDESFDLHDHPYDNVSIVLKSGFVETLRNRRIVLRKPGAVVFRRAATPHRLSLLYRWDNARSASPVPSISLFITGPRKRQWGFHTANGWVPYYVYNARANNTSDDPQ